MLGALTAFWISIMLLFIFGVIFAAGTIVSAIGGINESVKVDKNSVVYLPLSGLIEERQTAVEFAAFLNNEDRPASLDDMLRAISAAKGDDRIKGIFLDCRGASAGVATRMAVRRALSDFKSSGKWIVAYADNYTQGDYYVASVANNIYLNPVGMVDIRGLGSSVPFFKGLLDKLGVEMQIIKVGTYKSAVEPFILTSMSEPSREQTSVFLNNIWGQLTSDIHASRNISVANLNLMADSLTSFSGNADIFVDNKLVDGLKYRREVEAFLKEKLGQKKDDSLKSVDYYSYLQVADVPHEKSEKNKIAVYYAFGDIVDTGTQGISAQQMVPDIINLAEDDDIKAMVLRVNSGGGSAFASEQIWEALGYFKSKGKKLYVSMGDYAASGGYYISCGADKIYAEPVTLTGSIGIFGLIPNIKGFLNDKLGLNMVSIATNPNANISITEPFTPVQRAAMQSMVNRGYETFVGRCAEGRGVSVDSIKAIAEGRVWDGTTALEIGLVDKLGSLTDCISDLAADQGYDKYTIVEYPDPKGEWWEELLMASSNVKQSLIKSELGEALPYYEAIQQVKKMSPVQCRMEYIVVE